MIWLVGSVGLVIGFVLGVCAVRRLIHVERAKALEMATLLIQAQRLPDQLSVVHMPSVSFGCPQQFHYDVTFGIGHGTEE